MPTIGSASLERLVELDEDDDRLGLHRAADVDDLVDVGELAELGHRLGDPSSEGRESTSPTAPSSSWWVISTTVRRKFGSTSDGEEIEQLAGERLHAAQHRTQPARGRATPASATATAASWSARQPLAEERRGRGARSTTG